MGGKRTLRAYRRENGRVGIRNHVIILPLDDISNAACEAVGNNIQGTLAIPHPYGRLQFGADLDLHFRTLIGTGSNPNVAAVVVIGIEPGWTGRVVDGIAETGKPVAGFAIEQTGDIGTIASASRKAQEYVQWASERQREECEISDLWISVKCGESDTTSGLASNPTVGNLIDKLDPLGVTSCFGETSELTGAEQECRSRAKTPEVGDKFIGVWKAYMEEVIEPNKTSDLSESQPTKGNIEGGLTTIEEKAFGNLEKIGKKTRLFTGIQGIVDRFLDCRKKRFGETIETEKVAVFGEELTDGDFLLAGRHRLGRGAARPHRRRPTVAGCRAGPPGFLAFDLFLLGAFGGNQSLVLRACVAWGADDPVGRDTRLDRQDQAEVNDYSDSTNRIQAVLSHVSLHLHVLTPYSTFLCYIRHIKTHPQDRHKPRFLVDRPSRVGRRSHAKPDIISKYEGVIPWFCETRVCCC